MKPNGKLRDAYDRCRLAHDSSGGAGFVAVVWVECDKAEQIHHGTTDYALAAWLDWRRDRAAIRKARGVVDYLVPDLEGRRTIANPALVLETADGEALALTGCTWGYGGEGPHGSAVVLLDAGFFPDFPAALRFVAALDGVAGWELVNRARR